MIIERMIFRLKFGKARPAIEIWKKIFDVCKTKKDELHMRMLTDLTGSSYTLVIELQLRSLMDFGPKMHAWLSDEQIRDLYQEFIPLCESAERVLYKLEQEI